MVAVLDGDAVQLRPMRPSHLDAVMEIEQRAYPFPWTKGNFADSLNAGYSMWVLENGGELIGYFVMMMAVDEAHLLNITVAPRHQSRGWGRRLMGEVFALARGHRAHRLFLEVRPSNAPALHLYRSVGMHPIGLRRGYYPDAGGRREDALVLAIDLA